MYFILWPNDNLMLVFGNANEFNLWGSYLLGLLCPKITCSNSKETIWLFHANLICGIYKITISIRVSCKPGFEPWASTVHAKCSGLWDDPYQALFLHACSSHETAPFMPSSQAQGWPLFMHGFHAWSGHETAPFMPLSLRPLGESCLRLHRFHAWSRPWDSTVSCLDLRPSVMRQHRFMPSSQTVKDHPVSCHEIAPFHAYISGIQGSNLSCTISHIAMPWDCTVHV